MKLRWLNIVNGLMSQKNRKTSDHLADWRLGFASGKVKDIVGVPNVGEGMGRGGGNIKVNGFVGVPNDENGRKRGGGRRNTVGSIIIGSNWRRNYKVGGTNESQKRGFTSKRCSGEFDFIFSCDNESGSHDLEAGNDEIWARGDETAEKIHPKTQLDDRRFWLEKRSLTMLDERVMTNANVIKDAEVLRGQMWVQRSSLFSQWKERHLVLRGRVLEVHRLEGGLVNLIGLSDVEKLELAEKQGTLTVCVSLNRATFYMRRAEGLDDWFKSLRDGVRNNRRENNLFLCPVSGEEPRITMEELTRLYREEEKEEVEEARRRGRRDFGFEIATLKEEEKMRKF